MSLFEDSFEVTAVNPEGKKFDKVNRLLAVCRDEQHRVRLELVLDIPSQLWKLGLDDRFDLALRSTLSYDGTPDPDEFNQSGEPSHADRYEYVMHGKVFKVQQSGRESTMEVFTSYGGLLMSLKGPPNYLQKIVPDMRMYLLINKVKA